MFALAQLILREALRNRMAWLALLLVAGALSLSWFLSGVALTEAAGLRAAAAGAVLRLGCVALTVVFVTTSMTRDLSDKSLELLLSLPLPRWQLLVGKLLGYAAVAAMIGALATASALMLAPWQQSIVWGVTLTLELVVMATFSVMCLLSLAQPTVALIATIAFYVLARAMAAIQLMAHGPMLAATAEPGLVSTLMTGGTDLLALVLPRLDQFANASWLVYPVAGVAEVGTALLQAVIYVALLSTIALVDLYRRNF
ncbi:MAG: ABC transporter permease [Pseudomonadota bacterium]